MYIYWINEDEYKESIQNNDQFFNWSVSKSIVGIKREIESVQRAFHPEESLVGKTYLVCKEQDLDRAETLSRVFRRYEYKDEKLKLIAKDYQPEINDKFGLPLYEED